MMFLLAILCLIACSGEQAPFPFVKRLSEQFLRHQRALKVSQPARQARCLPTTALISGVGSTCAVPKKQVPAPSTSTVVFESSTLRVQHRLIQPNQSVVLDSATTVHIVTKPSSLMLLTDQLFPLRSFTPQNGEIFSLKTLKTHRVRYLKNVGGEAYGELLVETKTPAPTHGKVGQLPS